MHATMESDRYYVKYNLSIYFVIAYPEHYLLFMHTAHQLGKLVGNTTTAQVQKQEEWGNGCHTFSYEIPI